MAKALELNADNFQDEVLNAEVPVLVDFWAPWCQPCVMMAPVLDDLAGEMEGTVKIAKLNIDDQQHQQLAMEYGVQSIPNMKLFKNGSVEKEFVGLRPKGALKSELEDAIA